jgi:hypothetical protein
VLNDGEHRWFLSTNNTSGAGAPVSLTQAMTLTSAGLLGLGTASPSGVIHADAASGVDGPVFDSGGTGDTNHALLVRDSGNSQLFRVNNNGKVGINDSSPDFALDCNVASGDLSSIAACFSTNAAQASISFQGTGTTDNGSARFGIKDNDNFFMYQNDANTFFFGEDAKFGINTMSPSVPFHMVTTDTGAAALFDAQGSNNVSYARYQNDQDSFLEVSHYGSARSDTFAGISLANYSLIKTAGTHNGLIIGTSGSDPMIFATNNTESARIDSSGNLLIGYTSSNGSYKLQVNSQIFATNATIATSDGRYKEDVQTLSNATDLVSRLNPVQFKWKAHEIHNLDVGKTDVGFIAQEVQEVLSDTDYSDSVVVTNKTDDEEYLGLGETKLIPLLTAALQEAITKIETLETKVAALEAA